MGELKVDVVLTRVHVDPPGFHCTLKNTADFRDMLQKVLCVFESSEGVNATLIIKDK